MSVSWGVNELSSSQPCSRLHPTLKPGDIVIMDNLGSHKGKVVRALIRSVGAKLFFLPKYSPDLNPIEQVFAKLEHLLRKPTREPSRPSGPQSVRCSQPSRQRNAPTTSKTQDTHQPKFIPL
jgi:transposase